MKLALRVFAIPFLVVGGTLEVIALMFLWPGWAIYDAGCDRKEPTP